MNRRSILAPVAVLATIVAASPATAADGNGWAATFRDTSSAKLFACKIAAGQIACD